MLIVAGFNSYSTSILQNSLHHLNNDSTPSLDSLIYHFSTSDNTNWVKAMIKYKVQIVLYIQDLNQLC